MALNFPSNPAENDIYQFGLLTYIFKNGKWVSQSRGASQLPWYSNMEQARAFWKRLAAEAGLNLVDGSFEEGAEVASSSDVVWWQAGSAIYGWHLNEAKTVPAGSTPETAGCIGAGAWVDRTQDTLRDELTAPGGASIIDGGYLLVAPLLPSKTTNLASAISSILSSSISNSIYPVHLRNGVYLSDGLVIPANSSLIGVDITRAGMTGNWINGDSDETHGTTFWTEDTVNPLFDVRTGAQIKNINVWQRGQTKVDSVASIVTFPPVFKISSVDPVFGNADNVIVKNVSALNCFKFVEIGDGINPVGRSVIEDVFANSYSTGVRVRTLTGDVVMLNRVYIENIFTTTPAYMPNIHEHLYTNVPAFVLEDSQGVNLTDCIALNYGNGIIITGNTWAQIENFLADQCGISLLVAGCDKVMVNNSSLVANRIVYSPTIRVYGDIAKHLSISNSQIGSYYENIKTGIYCDHAGKILLSNNEFETKFPAVLNTGNGSVEINNCGIDYRHVVGENISIDGGPSYVKGGQITLTNLNPTVPAATGWTYVNPANVTAISGGIKIAGAGNNTIYYQPESISTDNLNSIRYGSNLYVLSFDLLVRNQGGSPRLNILVTDALGNELVECFQVCSDGKTGNSALPEEKTLSISLLLPWHLNARSLAFSLPYQTSQEFEITNMAIHKCKIPLGFTGLEFFKNMSLGPSGYFDPSTGNSILKTTRHPDGGSWVSGDKWEFDSSLGVTPTSGQPSGGIYYGGTWFATGVFS